MVALLMKRRGRVTWDGLVMFIGELERVNRLQLREQKDKRKNTNNIRNSQKDMPIKEVTKSKTLDGIEWQKRLQVANID